MRTLFPTALATGVGVLERESAWSFNRDLSLSRAGLSTGLAQPLVMGLTDGVGRGVVACFGVC